MPAGRAGRERRQDAVGEARHLADVGLVARTRRVAPVVGQPVGLEHHGDHRPDRVRRDQAVERPLQPEPQERRRSLLVAVQQVEHRVAAGRPGAVAGRQVDEVAVVPAERERGVGDARDRAPRAIGRDRDRRGEWRTQHPERSGRVLDRVRERRSRGERADQRGGEARACADRRRRARPRDAAADDERRGADRKQRHEAREAQRPRERAGPCPRRRTREGQRQRQRGHPRRRRVLERRGASGPGPVAEPVQPGRWHHLHSSPVGTLRQRLHARSQQASVTASRAPRECRRARRAAPATPRPPGRRAPRARTARPSSSAE